MFLIRLKYVDACLSFQAPASQLKVRFRRKQVNLFSGHWKTQTASADLVTQLHERRGRDTASPSRHYVLRVRAGEGVFSQQLLVSWFEACLGGDRFSVGRSRRAQ